MEQGYYEEDKPDSFFVRNYRKILVTLIICFILSFLLMAWFFNSYGEMIKTHPCEVCEELGYFCYQNQFEVPNDEIMKGGNG